MSYSAESHTNFLPYDATISMSSGTNLEFTVDLYNPDGSPLTEDARDATFQTFLTDLAGIAGATVVSATKRGQYAATVTP